ncbi:CLUMA_CG004105, isoform A [Clunio marinus]|uniref:CLUMA_CG004105, isoform A n=1 Tax=Clunio marinus TaxID=568069 RepID=A0A1J1HS62_9DIPT|nr:CLUMA_CG004105, isoform A [Clunio marinus]
MIIIGVEWSTRDCLLHKQNKKAKPLNIPIECFKWEKQITISAVFRGFPQDDFHKPAKKFIHTSA